MKPISGRRPILADPKSGIGVPASCSTRFARSDHGDETAIEERDRLMILIQRGPELCRHRLQHLVEALQIHGGQDASVPVPDCGPHDRSLRINRRTDRIECSTASVDEGGVNLAPVAGSKRPGGQGDGLAGGCEVLVIGRGKDQDAITIQVGVGRASNGRRIYGTRITVRRLRLVRCSGWGSPRGQAPRTPAPDV